MVADPPTTPHYSNTVPLITLNTPSALSKSWKTFYDTAGFGSNHKVYIRAQNFIPELKAFD